MAVGHVWLRSHRIDGVTAMDTFTAVCFLAMWLMLLAAFVIAKE